MAYSGLYFLIRRAISAASLMLPLIRVRRFLDKPRRFSLLPEKLRELTHTTRTEGSRLRRSRIKLEPINPAPPVTNIVPIMHRTVADVDGTYNICYNTEVMKGLILAGGKGTRLQPATFTMNKHMVPILNKPMILYPLETLKHAGITDIMVVTGGDHIGAIAEFLGDGSQFGVQLTYRVQKEAGGIAHALGLAQEIVGADSITVILGDNIF